MKMIESKSSLVNSFGYDEKTLEFAIVLKGKLNIYQTSESDPTATLALFEGIKIAESAGKFYNQVIRKSGLSFSVQ